jgi:hypothetical protein
MCPAFEWVLLHYAQHELCLDNSNQSNQMAFFPHTIAYLLLGMYQWTLPLTENAHIMLHENTWCSFCIPLP